MHTVQREPSRVNMLEPSGSQAESRVGRDEDKGRFLLGLMWSKSVEKLLNYFLFLYLKYENENSKVGHENKRELTKYREFQKRTNSSGFTSNTVDIRKFYMKYRYVVPSV